MPELKIRKYASGDLDDVLSLHRVALEQIGAYVKSGEWDKDLLNIEQEYVVFLVGALGNKIVAMGALRCIDEKKAEIKRMRVLPELQGRGFGQTILTALQKEAKEKGFTVLCLDTTALQIAAQGLYKKNGFLETRRTKEGFPFETIFYEKNIA